MMNTSLLNAPPTPRQKTIPICDREVVSRLVYEDTLTRPSDCVGTLASKQRRLRNRSR